MLYAQSTDYLEERDVVDILVYYNLVVEGYCYDSVYLATMF